MSLPQAMELLGENWINANCNIGVSETDKVYMYDQKRSTQWVSENLALTMNILFYDNLGNSVERDFNRIILNNMQTGAKSIAFKYRKDGAWTYTGKIPVGTTDLDYVFSSSVPIIGDGVQLQFYDCDNLPRLGELKVCNSIFDMDALTSFERKDYSKQGSYYVNSGSIVRWKEFAKKSGILSIANLSKTDRDLVYTAIDANDFFTIIFYEDYDAKEIYEYALTSMPSEVFDRKTQLFLMSLDLTER